MNMKRTNTRTYTHRTPDKKNIMEIRHNNEADNIFSSLSSLLCELGTVLQIFSVKRWIAGLKEAHPMESNVNKVQRAKWLTNLH